MSSLRPRQNDLGRQEIATLDSSLNSHRQPRFSDKHASSVPLVLNPQAGYITPQFHIVFDDWFATVPASADDLPNFNDDCWQRMFRDSTFQYVLDDEDEERLIAGSTDYEQANELLSQMQRVATALDNATPPQVLPVAPPPLSTPLPPPRSKSRRHHQSFQTLPSSPTPIRPANESDKVSEQPVAPKATKAKSTPVKHEPRRSTRNRSAPVRLGYDGQQGHGYMAEFDGTSLEWLYNEVAECLSPPPSSYKASVSDPDTLSFSEAMADRDNIEKWLKAANDEIQSLQKNGTWIEVPITEAKTRILPGTWVFRRKRTPDGTITLRQLGSEGFNFTREGTFTDFLGINFTRDATNGTLTLTQKGLIQKIKEATGMSDSNYNWTPAAQAHSESTPTDLP
ncbi:hypothetical protein MHU86_5419 [Fragilaria crotonensis]|nr:hypothetical protein MHU86_5419 [Fragilaria crotonensis]